MPRLMFGDSAEKTSDGMRYREGQQQKLCSLSMEGLSCINISSMIKTSSSFPILSYMFVSYKKAANLMY
jgi:hypothetical protein